MIKGLIYCPICKVEHETEEAITGILMDMAKERTKKLAIDQNVCVRNVDYNKMLSTE